MDVDIRDYGAAGDGATDDTEALRRAAEDAGEHGSVLLPDGVFVIRHFPEQMNIKIRGGSVILELARPLAEALRESHDWREGEINEHRRWCLGDPAIGAGCNCGLDALAAYDRAWPTAHR